jgi:hypothetical protein
MPGRHLDLRAHQIDPRHLLGDGMLHLEPGVHLQEIEGRVVTRSIEEKLDRACVDVAGGAGHRHGGRAHAPAQGRRHGRGWRLLDHFLVPALDRTFALEQMHDPAVAVGDDLKLDVTRVLDQPLDVERSVAEGGRRLTTRLCDRRQQRRLVAHRFHADPAAALGGFEQHRQADPPRRLRNRAVRLIDGCVPRHDRRARRLRQLPGGDLRSHFRDDLRRRPDKGHAGVGAGRGEIVILGEESVARMDGLRPGRACGSEDGIDRQIAVHRRGGTDPNGLIGGRHMQRVRIGVRIHRDGLDATLAAGADDAHGDLAAIGDQNPLKHDVSLCLGCSAVRGEASDVTV